MSQCIMYCIMLHYKSGGFKFAHFALTQIVREHALHKQLPDDKYGSESLYSNNSEANLHDTVPIYVPDPVTSSEL